MLEDHADPAAHFVLSADIHAPALIPGFAGADLDIPVFAHGDGALVGNLEEIETAHQTGFPGAGIADDAIYAAIFNGEGDAVQCRDVSALQMVGFFQITDFNHGDCYPSLPAAAFSASRESNFSEYSVRGAIRVSPMATTS